jgi:hypothetical protein
VSSEAGRDGTRRGSSRAALTDALPAHPARPTPHPTLLGRPQCLKRVEKKANKADAARELTTLAQGGHYIPGDAGWPLGGVMPAPRTPADAEGLRGYFRQLREATVARLVDRVFNEDGTPNRHWMAYAKKKFMSKEFP